MADEILIPGTSGTALCDSIEPKESPNYLIKDNYLSEFQTEIDKEVVRENLGVHKKEDVYTKTEVDNNIKKQTGDRMRDHLAEDDPHQIMSKVEPLIWNLARQDGTTPFTSPQGGVDPVLEFHLTTKRFVNNLLNSHIDKLDPHNVMLLVREALEAYVEKSQVYLKRELYTKKEIDRLFQPYITKDGSIPFVRPQVGVTPTLDNHLSTKKYVDESIYSHLVDVDPHGFIEILNRRLAQYVKVSTVYDKSQTYSRSQIDSIIRGLVREAAREVLIDHLNEFDPHNVFTKIRNEEYVKQNGTTPFKAPQEGVDAVNPQDLVTLHQVDNKVDDLLHKIDGKKCEWKTSGPVIESVGLVEAGTEFSKEVSLQEIMDAVFYGKGINITSTELVSVGESSKVTVCVQGTLASFEYGEIYQEETLIQTFDKEDFRDESCITINSLPIKNDTMFTFKAFYTNGAIHEVNTITKVSMPIFIGILPKWRFGSTVTYEYLTQLHSEDSNNNKFYNKDVNLSRLDHMYSFSGNSLVHLFIAIPTNYPNLLQMETPSQQFGTEAFDIINMTPLKVPGLENDVIYKLYIYSQAIVQLNNSVTFKFNNE